MVLHIFTLLPREHLKIQGTEMVNLKTAIQSQLHTNMFYFSYNFFTVVISFFSLCTEVMTLRAKFNWFAKSALPSTFPHFALL